MNNDWLVYERVVMDMDVVDPPFMEYIVCIATWLFSISHVPFLYPSSSIIR